MRASRGAVDGLTYHGGRIDVARAAHPGAPEPWIDLSTGINPHPWPAAAGIETSLTTLPSPSALAQLNRIAAIAMGAGGCTAVPGAEVALNLLAVVDLPRPWRIVGPCYRSYAAALPGATVIGADALHRAAGDGGTILLGNPNNPDGRVTERGAVLETARVLAKRGGMLIVDEAFADAVPEASVAPDAVDGGNLVVLRSFGKFFGLPGLRLGFVIGAAEVTGRIAGLLGSWPVSGPAIVAGTAAYADAGWIAATRERLVAAAAARDAVLRRHGLMPRGGCPLFTLIERSDAGDVFARLARAGILTRPFDYDPTWLRIGLPADADALARLDGALAGG